MPHDNDNDNDNDHNHGRDHAFAPTPAPALAALATLIACGGAIAPRRRLLEAWPDPQSALDAGVAGWRACGLSAAQIGALLAPDATAIARVRLWLEIPRHHLIGWHDPDYPPLLRRSPAPPLALFVAGDPATLWHPAVAVVGSRSPTPNGRDNAASFARAFAASGLAVTSGMAAGIDTAAHLATLEAGGPTVAVLGTGPDVPYPRSNTGLLARIAQHGTVVSEHLPGTGPLRQHFPSRNRILAGLSLGTVVIEAAHRSGALITARLAADAGREVFALPGSIHNPLSRGCHRLIRDGANLVESAAEVVDALAPLAATLAADLRQRLGAPITVGNPIVPAAAHEPLRPLQPGCSGSPADDPTYQNLWKALGHDPTGMDQLVERTGLTPANVSSMLLLMELEGRVATQHGRYFRNR